MFGVSTVYSIFDASLFIWLTAGDMAGFGGNFGGKTLAAEDSVFVGICFILNPYCTYGRLLVLAVPVRVYEPPPLFVVPLPLPKPAVVVLAIYTLELGKISLMVFS